MFTNRHRHRLPIGFLVRRKRLLIFTSEEAARAEIEATEGHFYTDSSVSAPDSAWRPAPDSAWGHVTGSQGRQLNNPQTQQPKIKPLQARVGSKHNSYKLGGSLFLVGWLWGRYTNGCYLDFNPSQILIIRVYFNSNMHGIGMNQDVVYAVADLLAWLGNCRPWKGVFCSWVTYSDWLLVWTGALIKAGSHSCCEGWLVARPGWPYMNCNGCDSCWLKGRIKLGLIVIVVALDMAMFGGSYHFQLVRYQELVFHKKLNCSLIQSALKRLNFNNG
ncbi:hypothetical protein E3N88_19579 [Mikania micrantha]|uniref:Uncharacterized protein n=1 Tax=Mikania micrantha TaxID=192012 RepID=A0A5N6NQJ6_9ASTR|nr:hypothetical protein E3N88_19579 [Mikania micrantha]